MRILQTTSLLLAFASGPALAQTCDVQWVASNPLDDQQFGSSIASDGDVLAVGATEFGAAVQGGGVVHVYRDIGGVWMLEDVLTSSIGAAGDSFGASVAVDGDLIVVGASRTDLVGVDSGAVFVFRDQGGVWVEEQILAAGSLSATDFFGLSVSVSGDRIAASSPGDSAAGAFSGSVAVFRLVVASWIQEAMIVSGDLAAGDLFGASVALDGSRLLVGATGEDTGANAGGAVYAFERDVVTGWSQVQKIIPLSATVNAAFGRVALSGDDMAVGAAGDPAAGPNGGAVHVFAHDGTSWNELGKYVPPGAETGDKFGTCVAIDGDFIVGGAPGDDDRGLNAGAAYTLDRTSGIWTPQRKIGAFDGLDGDGFGAGASVSGDLLFTGAPGHAVAGVPGAGALYVHDALATDCNANLIDDACELAAGTGTDCDGNGTLDECDLASGAATDCNNNGTLDTCDIAAGTEPDLNGNGVIDYCEPALGISYCTPNQNNSTGGPAFISAHGSDVVLDQNLLLHAVSLPPNQFGYFLTSLTPGVIPFPGGSQGVLCLSGTLGRFNAQVFQSGPAGLGTILVDMTAIPLATGPVSIAAGDTWYFQAWHRDVNPTATSNFSDGVQVLFF